MSRVQVYINNKIVDIDNEEDLGLRVSTIISDANNLDARGGTFTFTLKFPLSNNNDIVFGHIRDLQVIDKFNKGFLYEASIYVDGNEIISGNFRLRSIESSYDGEIYGNNIAWSNTIQSLSLRDIKSFADADFVGAAVNGGAYNLDWYVARNIDSGIDINFPLVSYGTFFNPSSGVTSYDFNSLSFDDIPPSFYYLNIVKKIFEDQGIRVRGKIFDNQDVKKILIPYVGDTPFKWNWAAMAYAEAGYNSATYFENYDRLQSIRGTNYVQANVTYTVRSENEPLSLNVSVGGSALDPSVLVLMFYDLYEADGTTIFLSGSHSETVFADFFGGYNINYTFPNIENSTPGMLLKLRAQTLGSLTQSTTYKVTPGARTKINIAENLPDINQKEFIKSFITLFNLFFRFENNVITFLYKEDFYKEPSVVINIDKQSDIITIKQEPISLVKKLQFKYTNDASDHLLKMDKEYGNFELNSNSIYAEGIKTISVPFSTVKNRVFISGSPYGDLSISIPSIADTAAYKAKKNEVSDISYSYTPRLIAMTNVIVNGLYVNGSPTDLGISSFPLFLFWENLYNIYYKTKLNLRGHRISLRVNLTFDQYDKLNQNFNVELMNESYQLEKFDTFDPLGIEATNVTLIKNV